MRTLVLWCPDWPLSAAGFAVNDLVAVVDAGRVSVASGAARAAGVRVGSRRREAESRCPGLVVLSRDSTGEAQAFEPVIAAVATLTPAVEVTRPGLLALDLRGPARYFGGEEVFLARVTQAATVAMPVPGCPLPRAGAADSRFGASMAARRGVLVPAGQDAAFLAPFPVGVLGLAELADLLGRLGIRTLGQFAALDEGMVLARFGIEGGRAHRLARGVEVEPLRAQVTAEEVVVVAEFDPPAEKSETAAFAARGLADDLVGRLGARGLGCARVLIEAQTEHGESLSRLWRGDDILGPEAIVERLRWQLDGWLSGTVREPSPTAGITRLALTADEVVVAGGRQLGLWGGRSDVERRAVRGLDRLRGMLGPEAIFTAALAGGRGPADRVIRVALGEPAPTDTAVELPWPGRHPLPAPALVYLSPIPVEVHGPDGAAVTVSARGRLSAEPARLCVDGGGWAVVAGWAGPWTVDERWWDRRARRRVARFQIVTEDQTAHLCLIEGGSWWIEATYG